MFNKVPCCWILGLYIIIIIAAPWAVLFSGQSVIVCLTVQIKQASYQSCHADRASFALYWRPILILDFPVCYWSKEVARRYCIVESGFKRWLEACSIAAFRTVVTPVVGRLWQSLLIVLSRSSAIVAMAAMTQQALVRWMLCCVEAADVNPPPTVKIENWAMWIIQQSTSGERQPGYQLNPLLRIHAFFLSSCMWLVFPSKYSLYFVNVVGLQRAPSDSSSQGL